MTKIHYIATDANGTVHTRSTASRAYTHTVVIRWTHEGALADAVRYIANMLKDYRKRFADVAAGEEAFVADGLRRHAILGRDYFNHRFADELAFTVKHGTPEAAAEELSYKVRREIADRLAAGYYDVWRNAGWCGRRDLAEKLAAKERAKGYPAHVLVAVEAPAKVKIKAPA